MKEILVLMSTYNGERFLDEQLASIYAQEGDAVRLLVRDDGSVDRTCEILESWHVKKGLDYFRGANVGPAKSFLELLKTAPRSDYYAFADQDDFWYPEKLSRAHAMLSALHANDRPLLYFANVDLTDAGGHVKQQSLRDDLFLTKYNALIESHGSGCTMVFNDALRQEACVHLPVEDVYHDRWLYLTAMFKGQVVYDGRSCMGYRQHGGNQVGTQTEAEKGSMVRRIFRKGRFSVTDTAALFLQYYGADLTDTDREIVRTCANYKNNLWCKCRLLFHPDYRLADNRLTRSVYWKLRILLNRI